MSLLASRSVWTEPGTLALRHTSFPICRNVPPLLSMTVVLLVVCVCACTSCTADRSRGMTASISLLVFTHVPRTGKVLYTPTTNRAHRRAGKDFQLRPASAFSCRDKNLL